MKFQNIKILGLAMAMTAGFASCKKDKDEDDSMMDQDQMLKSSTIMYEFNNGQISPENPYKGMHSDDLTATMELMEMANGQTEIKIKLMNTIEGEMYHIHAHDAKDPSTTPNGTPYDETPNSKVFTKMVEGNGGEVMISQMTEASYDLLTTVYDGFFVVHDPLQTISTKDLTTYVVLGKFARQAEASDLKSMEHTYDFNTGQVAEAYAYSGTHANTLSAKLKVQALSNGGSRVSVMLMNTINDEMYMIHAHDAADASTTPNGTPYNETPNTGLLTKMITGNGSTMMTTQISEMSYTNITASYSGFFVVHDPLQAIDTTDPTTYVVLGSFAR